MSDKLATNTQPNPNTPANLPNFDRAAGARILARTFYKELRDHGYSPRQLLAVSTELIDLITQDLQNDRKAATGTA